MAWSDFAVPILESGAGGLAQMQGARERDARKQQESAGYVDAVKALAGSDPRFKALADAAARNPAIAAHLYDTMSGLTPEMLKEQKTEQGTQTKRNTVMGILQERIQRESDPDKLRDLAYWMTLVADPNTDPSMYDKAIEHFAPKDPSITMDPFEKWMRDTGRTMPTDPAGKQALYQQFTQSQAEAAGTRAGSVAAAQLPYAAPKAEESAAGRTIGSLEATRRVAAPDVLQTADDLEKSGAKIFPEHAGLGVSATAWGRIPYLRSTGDPNYMAFRAARATLIDYAKLLASGQRLTRTEFEQINNVLETDNLSMDAIRQVTSMMRRAANRPPVQLKPASGAGAGGGRPAGLMPTTDPNVFTDGKGGWYDATGKPIK